MTGKPIQLKRTVTPDSVPGTLEEGEVVFGLGDDPVKMWVGTLTGVRQLFNVQPIAGGQFRIVGSSPASAAVFVPYKNDAVVINGRIYQIPRQGVMASLTDSLLDGAVDPGGTYRVYLFDDNGTLRTEISAAAHATSTAPGNEGTEIKTGDDTRTLIGLLNFDGSGLIYNSLNRCTIRSWFNRQSMTIRDAFNVTINANTMTEISWIQSATTISFVAFAGERYFAAASGRQAVSALGPGTSAVTSFALRVGEPGNLLTTMEQRWSLNHLIPASGSATGDTYVSAVWTPAVDIAEGLYAFSIAARYYTRFDFTVSTFTNGLVRLPGI